MENREKMSNVTIAVIIVIVLIVVGNVVKNWNAGPAAMISSVIWSLLKYAVVGGIVWLAWYIFIPQRKDMIWVARNNIVDACKARKSDRVQALKFRGMGEDGLESREIGYITGVAKMKTEQLRKIVISQGREKLVPVINPATNKPVEKDLIALSFKRTKNALSFLEKDQVALVPIDDLTDLNMDIVYIKDSCFAPKFYEFLFPAKYYKETYMIDEVAKSIIFRYQLQDLLRDMGEISEDMLDLSPKVKKMKSLSKAQELGIPNPGPQMQQQGPYQ